METGKQIAAMFFSIKGFEVEEIPTAGSPRADLRATDGTSVYLIEAKDKEEDAKASKERLACFDRGDLYEQQDLLSRSNRIKGILMKARDQLDNTPRSGTAFQLIWFHATGVDADTKYRQAFATFYGYVHIIPVSEHRNESAKECFYFDYNAAFEMPSVDALILSEQKTRDGFIIQLCLNEFSPRASNLRSSRLFKELAASGSTVDPPEWEALGRSISLRSSVPRKNDPPICKSLHEQTGVWYTPIRLTRYAASSLIR